MYIYQNVYFNFMHIVKKYQPTESCANLNLITYVVTCIQFPSVLTFDI